MTNNELICIYTEALNDWRSLINRYNIIKDKNFMNVCLKLSECECNNSCFCTVREGTIETYITNENGIAIIKEPFTIISGNVVQPYVTVQGILDRISLLKG